MPPTPSKPLPLHPPGIPIPIANVPIPQPTTSANQRVTSPQSPLDTSISPVENNVNVPDHITTGTKQRVSTDESNQPLEILVHEPEQLHRPTRTKNSSRYYQLAPTEFKHTSKLTLSKVNLRFEDHSDPTDTATGVITEIVRHAKSRKLCYKYYDHNSFDTAPKSTKQYNYINVKYTLNNCKFFKYKSKLQALSTFINSEQVKYNSGLTSTSKRKQHTKVSDLYANLATDVSHNLANHLVSLSALNLNCDGTILTSTSALNGPEKDIWMKAHGEEINRLVESGTGTFIPCNQVPQCKTIAYYNPHLKIKVKNGQLVY